MRSVTWAAMTRALPAESRASRRLPPKILPQCACICRFAAKFAKCVSTSEPNASITPGSVLIQPQQQEKKSKIESSDLHPTQPLEEAYVTAATRGSAPLSFRVTSI